MTVKKYLAREIVVIRGGVAENYRMSVATVEYDDCGNVNAVSVDPFVKELPGVEYSDSALRFEII